jgi:hypothetical protein
MSNCKEKQIREYIFLTYEGFTFQPNSKSMEPDIENLQVLGFSKGRNSKDAFKNLLKENIYLIDTTFDRVISYELNKDYKDSIVYHSMSELKESFNKEGTDDN